MRNQEHNCTVWLIQYSYAVDYYCMNYTAHFFTLILPRTVQYKVHTTIVFGMLTSNMPNVLKYF